MTTPTSHSARRAGPRLRLALVAPLLGALGCAPTLAPLAAKGEHAFFFRYVEARGDKPCRLVPEPPTTSSPCLEKNCVRARRDHLIRFESDAPGGIAVYFDPFRRNPLHGGEAFKVDERFEDSGELRKVYNFTVVAKGCLPLDPKVIVEP